MRMGSTNLSLVINVCHHSASLMMPTGDPRDRFFYPTSKIKIDSYNINVFTMIRSHSSHCNINDNGLEYVSCKETLQITGSVSIIGTLHACAGRGGGAGAGGLDPPPGKSHSYRVS